MIALTRLGAQRVLLVRVPERYWLRIGDRSRCWTVRTARGLARYYAAWRQA
jgi:hypothetical protein